ncbi:MAG: DUF2157 domain-containing protein [Alphaproteobacteria bacterium]|nr:DUF2157 domain-containing protein [Alphaproteobacteria bacterium]
MTKANENYWTTVLLYFAAFLIGLGIVAEVAANWQQIPNNIKLGGALAAMFLNALALIWTIKTDKNILKQVLVVIYAFLIMGVIGLIGQVYHLHSNVANACLLWSAISWPLIWVTSRLLWLWIPMFFIGGRYLPIGLDDVIIHEIAGSTAVSWGFDNVILDTLRLYLGLIFILFYEVWVNIRGEKDKKIVQPLRFYSGLLMLNLYCGASYFAYHIFGTSGELYLYGQFVFRYLGMAAIIYGLNRKFKRTSFMPWFFIGLLVQNAYIYIVCLVCQTTDVFLFGAVGADTVLPIFFSLVMWAYADYHKQTKLAKLAILAVILWFIGICANDLFNIVPSLMACAFVCGLAYYKKHRRWFNFGVIMAVLRILVYYGDVKNLQNLGMYLIVAGVLLIATILFLTKYAGKLWEKRDEK